MRSVLISYCLPKAELESLEKHLITLVVVAFTPIKGFGTERAILGFKKKKSHKMCFFTQKEKKTRAKFEVMHENLKTVLPAMILKKKFLTHNFTKSLNP